MAITCNFKPGEEQALEAHAYFTEVAGEWVDRTLEEMVPRQLMVEESSRPTMYMRIWSRLNCQGQAQVLSQWLRVVQRRAKVLARHHVDPMIHLPTLMDCPVEGANCLVEVLGGTPFTPAEKNLLTVGLRNGRTVLVSSPKMILVELEDGLLGLAVYKRGSWLIEGSAVTATSLKIHGQ